MDRKPTYGIAVYGDFAEVARLAGCAANIEEQRSNAIQLRRTDRVFWMIKSAKITPLLARQSLA